MLEQPADIVQGGLAHTAVALRVVEQVLPAFEEVLVEVHAAAGLAVERLGHEGDGFAVGVGGHLGGILHQHGCIAGCHQPHHRRLDLRLTRPAHLVVVVFHRHAHGFQVQRHLAAQVVELVFGRDGVIAAMQRDVVSVPAGGAVPVGFVRVQAGRRHG